MVQLLIDAGLVAVVFLLVLTVAVKKYPSRSTITELSSTNKDRGWVDQIFDLNTKWKDSILYFLIPPLLLILPLLFIFTIWEIIKAAH